ncbi:MlaD family protein [Nocardia sp. NPDC003482]
MTMAHSVFRRARWGVLGTVALFGCGCGIDPGSVPIPLPTTAEPTYTVRIELASALNLPAKAKVIANGTRVGTVARVAVVDPGAAEPGAGGHVVVYADIAKSVRLPADSTAELRQTTLLGDMHLALAFPAGDAAPALGDGGLLPLRQSRRPIQIEDTLAGLATFLEGGAVHQLQDIVNRFNTILPPTPQETARLANTVGADTMDLARNLDEVDALLNGFTADSQVMRDQIDVLATMLTEQEVQHITDAVSSIVGVIGVLGALGSVAHALLWLAPIADAGDKAAEAFVPLLFTSRPLDLDAPSNLNALVAWLRDKVIPFVEHGPKVNITRAAVTAAGAPVSADDQVGRIIDSLRMIGVVR